MEKQRRINTLVICGLLIVVGAMTIGFAALSQRLDIEGTATVKSAASSWNVYFSKVDNNTAGNGSFSTPPAISTDSNNSGSDNKITFACDLAAPGDSCTVTATVKNGGTTVAKYKGYTLSVGGLYHQRIMIVIKQKLVYLLFRLVVVLLTGQILILLLIRLVLDWLLLLMVIILLVVVIHITLINRTKLVLFFILCFR